MRSRDGWPAERPSNANSSSASSSALRRCLTREALEACPIDTRDRDDLESTALHALCRYARDYQDNESQRVDDSADIEVCLQLLVEAGADLEARDKLGCSPLQVLAWFSIVKFRTEATLRLTSLLLRHGANVNIVGFLEFELDIALFAAARDPATARRRMAASRRLLPTSAPCARRGYPCRRVRALLKCSWSSNKLGK